jgi:hypothetical protein
MKNALANTTERITSVTSKVNKAVMITAVNVISKLREVSGEGATEHTGWIAIGLIIVAAVITSFTPWGQNTVIPAIKDKMMGFINYSG